jgi:hypothetical protein
MNHGPGHTTLTGREERPTSNSPPVVQVCVLEPRCSLMRQMSRPGERTTPWSEPSTSTYERRSQIASQQGKCSLDGRCLILRHGNQRFRWSEPIWSPPPESNRRPHPYHGTTRNRCADRHFPRSRPTVRAKVIGSPSAKLCALFKPCADRRSSTSTSSSSSPPTGRIARVVSGWRRRPLRTMRRSEACP